MPLHGGMDTPQVAAAVEARDDWIRSRWRAREHRLQELPRDARLREREGRSPTASPATRRPSTAPPGRATAGFPTTCKTCHGVMAWQPATFDHNQTTFQLNGAHRTVDCDSCHRNGYTATPTDCFSCHQQDFNGARNPVHAGFATSCQDCHGVSAWQPAIFDHNQTGFQLLGAHRTVECTTCHRTGYAGTPSECFSCHQTDFTAARNPVHAGFPITCRECHGVTAWQPALFDHNATGFQLNGAHRSTECASCHRTGYAGTPSDCFSCHQSDFTGARNPSHSGFPNSCQDCHGVSAWQPATFDHNSTGFQLNGAHRSASCTSCHRSGYAGTPSECFSCHQSDFTGARNPSHTGFPNSCQDCHGVSAWQPATFDHNATGFQLNGAHRSASCTSCHRSGYAGTPSDCFSCHQSDFTGASNPSHTGFPNTCQDCHGVSAWQPASFDHNSTGFQLNGAHRSAVLHLVPSQRLRRHALRLLLLSPERLHRRQQSEPHRLPQHLSGLPRRLRLAAGDVRSQLDRLPAERRPSLGRLHLVPSQRLRRHAHRLLLLSPERLHRRQQSEPQRLPALLSGLPRRRPPGSRPASTTTRPASS